MKCPVCGIGDAPSAAGKCSPCAAEAVRQWVEARKAKGSGGR